MSGFTIPVHTYRENYVPFGAKVFINLAKLKQGKLLLKYKNVGPIKSFRGQRPISSEFRDFILEILQTGRLNVDSQKQLTKKDAKLLDEVLSITKTKEYLEYEKYEPSVQDYIKRFELLRGGLIAGNHSLDLREELIELIELLSHPAIGRISKADASEFIEMLI